MQLDFFFLCICVAEEIYLFTSYPVDSTGHERIFIKCKENALVDRCPLGEQVPLEDFSCIPFLATQNSGFAPIFISQNTGIRPNIE